MTESTRRVCVPFPRYAPITVNLNSTPVVVRVIIDGVHVETDIPDIFKYVEMIPDNFRNCMFLIFEGPTLPRQPLGVEPYICRSLFDMILEFGEDKEVRQRALV
jgi:hypothetical protein